MRLPAAIITLVLGTSQAAADWEYDFRRCAVSHAAGDNSVRFAIPGDIEFDAFTAESKLIENIARAQIGGRTFVLRPGVYFEHRLGSPKEVLPMLARGKRLKLFVEDKADPIIDVPISNGKKAVAFLEECKRQYRA